MQRSSSNPIYFLLMLVAINIVGCQSNSDQKKKQDQYDTTKSARKVKVEKSIPGLNNDTTIVAREFGYEALAFSVFKADTNKIKSLFRDPVILKTEKQTNGEGGLYDLYNFTDGVNKIVLYNNDGFYIEDAEIKNDRILLNRKISIGMKRDDFLKLLKVKNTIKDTINVTDEESTFESVYIFKDAKLQQIKMGQTLE